jgi:hypothetical protein
LPSSEAKEADFIESQITIYRLGRLMTAYEETEFLIPKIAFQMLVLILVATDVFLLVCAVTGIGDTPMWMFYASTAIFAAAILIFYMLRLHISVDDEKITIKYLKKIEIPFSDIIDTKTGDIDIIRNYSGWGMKNVKFKNYICHGYENGISLKLMGKRVITLSTADPEAIAALIPENKEDIPAKVV